MTDTTKTFTASNGTRIRPNATVYDETAVDSEGLTTFLTNHGTDALREFFLHEQDKELGRWRSQLHPEWTAVADLDVVHFRHDGGIRSFSVRLKSRDYSGWTLELREVAQEYLADHPEPKPWHDKKPGEVWELTYLPLGEPKRTRPFTVDSFGGFRNTQGVRVGLSHEITAARRIWPEEGN